VGTHLEKIGLYSSYNCFACDSNDVGAFFKYLNDNEIEVKHKTVTCFAWETRYLEEYPQRDFEEDCRTVISTTSVDLSTFKKAEFVCKELAKLGWSPQLVLCHKPPPLRFFLYDQLSAHIAFKVQGTQKHSQIHQGFVYEVRC